MLFNSFEYLLFLPCVFIIYWIVCKPIGKNLQNVFLILASYLFYGYWNWKFLILIFITTLCSFVSGLLINHTIYKKAVVWISLIINLGILFTFKYFNFFADNFSLLFSKIGIAIDNVTLDLILPIGISFYTFQALSYTIDVYKGKLNATKDIVAFFAFISFFPQLVAGPIERATNLLPQFFKERKFDYGSAVDGMRQILWGLFLKMLVADHCAPIVNDIFSNYQNENGMVLMVGAILFTFQIYGDFAGYSDIAIGTAKLFGIRLMRNFKFPYFSRDIAEFWRRWHISLTSWFRDYIYIPLGGSKCKRSKVARNTFVIFLTSGLWHGANWTYIAWGMYHAVLFLPLILTGKNKRYVDQNANKHGLPSINEILKILLTFILVVIGWVIFRAPNIKEAWDYICRMFTHFQFTLSFPGKFAMIWVVIMLVIEWNNRHRNFGLDFDPNSIILKYKSIRWSIYAIIFMLCIGMTGINNQFIYFQF